MSATRTGIAYLPLYYGRVPPWLFDRMVKLAREIVFSIVSEFGSGEMLRRLSHPYWVSKLSAVFWAMTGIQVVSPPPCVGLLEGIKGLEQDLGLFIAGGKGRTSRRTPLEIEVWGEKISLNPAPLVYASRMSALPPHLSLYS